MEDKNDPQVDEDILAEADRLAAEVEAEVAGMGDIGAFAELGQLEGLDQIPPELLEQLTPEQILELLAAQAQARKKPRSYYTRKQLTKNQRRSKRTAQKKARKVSLRNGGGRTISKRRRKRKAA